MLHHVRMMSLRVILRVRRESDGGVGEGGESGRGEIRFHVHGLSSL
jgi:hypothetical protein